MLLYAEIAGVSSRNMTLLLCKFRDITKRFSLRFNGNINIRKALSVTNFRQVCLLDV
jgi:hypothetical protein